ncbi:prepilin peptidase [Neptuniibacter caesariensis]|uniref:Prepilin leader peptidase/N-methyltransferase n=1 Tax=Neptuniibacter caesariensis TaxID=207954 RepID=A0A7U8GQV6_NEPCE|nr:A24 family peptidase [Neptuniibacter caesariensis]EAR59530.1 type 4 prepilin peptidase PilD [Oceanospirillum sp. MED92] [Neptuniibacter caesariensis]
MFEIPMDPAWASACAFILALCVGSFLNVVIHRLPIMMEKEWEAMKEPDKDQETYNLSVPASTCPKCKHRIRWYENVPVLSYAWLKGKCSSCGIHIPFRYPFVELLTAFSVAYVVHIFGANTAGLSLALLTFALICLVFIDIDHQLLPDSITLPLLWLGLLVNSFNIFTSLESAVYGAIAGYLSLWSVYWAFKLLTGKEGMGYGDFKLLAALGAWAGLSQLPLIILLSSLVGAIFGIAMIVTKKNESQQPIPFGPYLAIAGWIAILWGDQITGMYLKFAGF